MALLIPPSILLYEATHGPVYAGVAIATIEAIIGLLMLARVTVGVRALRERTAREQALREASGLLGAVQTREAVAAVLGTAARSMLPAGNTAASLLPADPSLTETIQVRETLGGTGYLRIPISVVTSDTTGSRRPTGEIRFSGPATRLFALRPALTGLADQAGAALQRISLEEAMREHQRDSYFRTLVQNSSDVILICRNGAVAYETPAARDLFANGTVVGTRVNELIAASAPNPNSGAGSTEATVDGPDGPRRVRVRRQDLTHDPTIHGVVLTLHDITEQQRLHEQLAYQATHDTLTGLPNRQLLRDHLRTAQHLSNAEARSAALFIDLDNLKEVNDTLGHAAGDELLTIAADRILGCLRRDDVAARLGGDEFAVLLSNLASVEAARDLAERVVKVFRRPVQLRDTSVTCTVSVGLADARTPDEYHTLLHRADTALYAAKAAGKNTWREHHVDLAEIR